MSDARRQRAERSREAIVARVVREQEALHPSPVYGARARRRLRNYLLAIFPLGMLLGWGSGWLIGWGTLERLGFGVGLVLALGYVGFVLLAERDDGRIQTSVRRLVSHGDAERPPGAGGDGGPTPGITPAAGPPSPPPPPARP